MAELEDFDDIDEAVEGEVIPEEYEQQPGWGRALAWATIILGGLYIVNPTAGVFELIPDVVPGLGNLDEAAFMFLIFGAMRYLGWTLPEFIERWTQPRARLPAPKRDE
jgi:hypothetical protein